MKNQLGFTLIEALMATALVGVAVGFSMDASRLLGWTYSYARHTSLAQRVAVAQMEALIATFTSDTRLTAGAHHQDYDVTGLPVAAPANGFSADWQVQFNTPITKIMRIDLTVSWTEDGATRNIHYVTFRSNG